MTKLNVWRTFPKGAQLVRMLNLPDYAYSIYTWKNTRGGDVFSYRITRGVEQVYVSDKNYQSFDHCFKRAMDRIRALRRERDAVEVAKEQFSNGRKSRGI